MCSVSLETRVSIYIYVTMISFPKLLTFLESFRRACIIWSTRLVFRPLTAEFKHYSKIVFYSR